MRTRLAGALVLLACAAACEAPNAVPITNVKATMADSADQVIFGLRNLITDRGLNRAAVEADTAFFFDDNTRVDMRVVRGVFFNAAGVKNSVLTSRAGFYNSQSGMLEARGDVIVRSVDAVNRKTLTTPFLRFDQHLNQLTSDSAFTLKEEPGRNVVGVGFRSDPDMQNITIKRIITSKPGTVGLSDK